MAAQDVPEQGQPSDPNEAVHVIAASLDYLRGLTLLERRFGPEHPKVAQCLDGIARLCRDLGRLDDAEVLLRRAVAILERHVGPENLDLAAVLENLTVLLYESGRDDEAGALFDRAKAARDAQARLEHAPHRESGA